MYALRQFAFRAYAFRAYALATTQAAITGTGTALLLGSHGGRPATYWKGRS